MHKILDVHLDRLRAWITDKLTDDEVRETFQGKKLKIFFRDLFLCRRWLADERILVAKWPLYKECIKENRSFDWEEEYRLVDYVVGSKEDFQDPWTSVDYVYSPFNVHVNHWVLLCLDLVSCQVKVWDSLPSLTIVEEMRNILLSIRELVPNLLDSTDSLLGEVDHRHTRNLGQLSLSTQIHYNEIIVIVAYSPLSILST
ncbi:hypothetical protein IC575_025492 [Cucumis melo]